MKRICLTLALLALAGIAQAQTRTTPCDPATPNNAICITGTPATTDTAGNALPGTPAFRVEQKFGTATNYTTVATGLTSLQYYAKNLAPGSYVFRVYQTCAGCVESAASAPATKDATPNPIQPNAPTIIIAATIYPDAPPTYRVIQTVTLKPNEVVFAAPASMRPLFAAR